MLRFHGEIISQRKKILQNINWLKVYNQEAKIMTFYNKVKVFDQLDFYKFQLKYSLPS